MSDFGGGISMGKVHIFPKHKKRSRW